MIALIAHDKKKSEMVEFVRQHVEFFRTQRLVATGHTGKLLHDELSLDVERVAHGPEGVTVRRSAFPGETLGGVNWAGENYAAALDA